MTDPERFQTIIRGTAALLKTLKQALPDDADHKDNAYFAAAHLAFLIVSEDGRLRGDDFAKKLEGFTATVLLLDDMAHGNDYPFNKH